MIFATGRATMRMRGDAAWARAVDGFAGRECSEALSHYRSGEWYGRGSGLAGCGVDDGLDGGDDVDGESAVGSVTADELFAGRDVDAEEFVGGDEGLDPLNLRANSSENRAGGLRRGSELFGSEFASVGKVAFDEKFRHCYSFAV